MADVELPPELTSQAFRQAGHVVAALQLGVTVRSVSIVVTANQVPGTRLAPLQTYVDAARTPKAVMQAVEDYVVVRLAGPTAQMIHAAHLWQSNQHTVSWHRWRARWKRKFDNAVDADTDFAAGAAIAWSECRTSQELARQLNTLWRRAEAILREPANWQKVGRLAGALLRHETMPGWQALEYIGLV